MQIELANFLADFWNPFCRILKELGWRNVSVDTSKQYAVSALLELNKNNPVGVLFTPNGNYGKEFKEWESLEWIVTKKTDPYPPNFNALFVDLDIKQTMCKDRDELFKTTQETRELLGLDPTWITKKWWGPHIFWVIDPKDRIKVHELLTTKEFEQILVYLSTQFIWWDAKPARMTAYMRMPNTLHWKISNIKKVWANPVSSKL